MSTEIIQGILATANAARAEGQKASIDNMLPSIAIVRGEDDEFYFQEHEATDLLDAARQTIHDLGEEAEETLDLEDVLLANAQSW